MSQIVRIKPPVAHCKKQQLLLEFFLHKDVQTLWVACGSKFGKAESIYEPIPTPKGWTTMGELKAGDYVFDEHGKPVLVEYVTDIMHGHECCEVVFSDKSKVICDIEHLWVTETHRERKNRARVASPNDRTKSTKSRPQVRTTAELRDTLQIYHGGRERPNHSIPTCGPLEFERKDLPIDPYVLGVWLGDGGVGTSRITKDIRDKEVVEGIIRAGYEVKKLTPSLCQNWSVSELSLKLKKLGILQEKAIPPEYLIAAIDQRLALLQGLMDTDGTVSKRGDCCFDNTNKNLADGVAALAVSLGIKVNRSERVGKLGGEEHKLCYRVWFTTDVPVFRLQRKLERIRPVAEKARRRYITAINPTPSVPVRCIRVRSETHLYLTGTSCIPTHNTLGASGGICNGIIKSKGAKWRWVAPIYQQAKIGFDHCHRILPRPPESVVKQGDLSIVLPSIESSIDFYHAQNPESLEGFGIAGYVFDEAAKMREDAFYSAKTTVTVTRGKMMIISTPLGKNWFYKGCMTAREEMLWARKNNTIPKNIFITARTEDNPYVSKESIDEARKTMPARLFAQYYMAEFIDDGSVFTGFRDCYITEEISIYNERQFWVAKDSKESTVVIGADWAKTVDWTVFFAIDIETKKVVGFHRFNKITFTEAIRELVRFSRSFKDTLVCYHDKTGVGGAIDDQLAYTDIPFKGITFSNALKNELVSRLMTSIEQKLIGLPYWDVLDKELDAYEVKTTPSGALTYSAPGGQHDDCVSALLLANLAMLEYGDRDSEIKFLEDLKSDGKEIAISPIEAYYNDLIADNE